MEKVMVVPAAVINTVIKDHGLIRENTADIMKIIKENYYFMPRDIAENNRDVRQIIPYVVVVCQDNVFTMRRLKKQFEKRLHGKVSIGVGGHINDIEPSDKNDVIMTNLLRELNEEINIKKISNLEFIGIINDLSTEVSWYHIGLLYILNTDMNVTVAEQEKMEGKWSERKALSDIKNDMETWSQIALEYLIR